MGQKEARAAGWRLMTPATTAAGGLRLLVASAAVRLSRHLLAVAEQCSTPRRALVLLWASERCMVLARWMLTAR